MPVTEAPYGSGAPPASSSGPATRRPPAPMRPAPTIQVRPAPSSRTVFAVLGAAVTLVGAAWFMAALARSGVLTRQVQLALAAGLAVVLYLMAGRAAPVIGEALRGLGYGILALCIGALVGTGVAAPGAVLAALLALSLAVGVHGAVQGRLLGTVTALAGASLSTWILADNLGVSPVPHLALLGLFACTVLAERRLTQPGSALLAFVPPVSLLGLLVTAAVHDAWGPPLPWAALLLGAVLTGLRIGLGQGGPIRDTYGEPAADSASSTPDVFSPPPRSVLGAAGLLLGGLLGAAPLLRPSGSGAPDGSWRLEESTTGLLLGLGAVCVALAVALHRRAAREGEGGPARLLRDAVLGVGVGLLGGALALGLDGFRVSTRLLGLTGAAALLGTWMRSVFWRWSGVAAVLLVLLDHLLTPWPSSVVVAGLALGTGVALGRRAGALVAAGAGLVLVSALAWAAPLPGLGSVTAHFLWAAFAALALHGLALGLARRGQPSRAGVLACGAVAANVLLVPAGLDLAAWPVQAAVFGLLTGALLYMSPAARLAAEVWGREAAVSGTWAVLEGLGVFAAVLGLLTWSLEELFAGHALPPLDLLLAGLAVLAALLPSHSRWNLRAWPVLALGVAVTALRMLDAPPSVATGLQTLLGAVAILAALWLLVAQSGRRWLEQWRGERPAGREVDRPWMQDGVLVALGLLLLALMGRTAELLRRAGPELSSLTSTSLSTAVLLAASVLALLQARRRERQVGWWVALTAFGLGALKLVFFDLGDLGGMARGAGTALIGLLLLGIGQLAPKPEGETGPRNREGMETAGAEER